MMDSIPVVCITGQVSAHLIGGDAFQETDITGITLPITKHNYLVSSVDEIAHVIREAFFIARSGRPGPVLVDICKNAQLDETEFVYPDEVLTPGYKPPEHAPIADLKKAVELIDKSIRPVILAGHGISMSGAMDELKSYAEKTQTPVAMTLLGLGSLPASHPYSLGMMGMHGEAYCNQAIQNADLLLAFGMRFDDRVTGHLRTYAPRARKIHIDIDPSEINKNVKVDVPLVGNLKTVLNDMIPLVKPSDHEDWLDQINTWKEETKARDILSWPDEEKLHSAHVIRDFWEKTAGDAIVTTGVGQHQMWTAQYYQVEKPYRLITSGGSGTMGFGLPSAIGAWFANPDKEIWTVDGDGSFQMSMNELATVVQEGANIKILLINNSFLGMVRQWQEFFFDKRYASTKISGPDFVKIGEAYGIPSMRITKRKEVMDAIAFAQETPGPVLIEYQVEKEDSVYPMVPSGAALDEMIRRPITRKKKRSKKAGE
jgi:acetolactate synthase-1/2/3 large subunit